MTLHLAVLGCGAIARTHARTLARFGPRVRLGFASRDGSRAVDYRSRFGGFAAYSEYDRALEDPRVGAVLITTPPADHLRLTLDALRAGKHVIVEKPAFLHSTDVDDVEAAAEEAGRRVLVAENYCYKPITLLLKALIDSGEIGAVRQVRISAMKYQAPTGWRSSPALAGGGALFEGGVHWIHLLGTLGGDITEVHGMRPGDCTGVERSMIVMVRFARGGVGTLHHSWETPALLRGLSLSQIIGTRGTVVFESNGLFAISNGHRRRYLVPGLRDLRGYRGMFDDFLTSLASGAPARMTLAAARRDLVVIEAAYRSFESPYSMESCA